MLPKRNLPNVASVARLVEQASAPVDHQAVAALVNNLGRGERYFAVNRATMTPEMRARYAQRLADLHPQVDAALAETGTRIEDHGWTTTRGIWHVIGEKPAKGRGTAAEEVAEATCRQVFEILADIPEADLSSRRRTRLETALSEAVDAEDLAAVTAAATALLDWAVSVKEAATPVVADAELRDRVFLAGQALGFPEYRISEGVFVGADREAWFTLCSSEKVDLLIALDDALAYAGGAK